MKLPFSVLALAAAALIPARPVFAQAEVRASAQPATIGVGDVFTYVVEARVAPGDPEPQAGDVRASPGAFRVLEPPRLERIESEAGVIVRLAQRLACLDHGCLPTKGPRRLLLPAARVTVEGATAVATPVAVLVRPRVAPASVTAGPRAYRRETLLPPPEARVDPSTAAWLLGATGLAFAAAALAFAASAALPFRRRRREGAFERAVRLLRESARRPPPDRRAAADLLARAVERRTPVAEDATVLAWSPPDPSAAEAELLAARAAREHA